MELFFKLTKIFKFINLRRHKPKKVTQRHKMGEEVNQTLPSTIDTIHSIDLIFGTYNELSLYFQLSETTWCLIRFCYNYNQINDVTSGRHLGFSNFQTFFIFELKTKNVEKTTSGD